MQIHNNKGSITADLYIINNRNYEDIPIDAKVNRSLLQNSSMNRNRYNTEYSIIHETEKIMNAQRARGVDFGEGSLVQKMKAVIPLLIPLFVSSFNRAEDLATAMEARGYQGGEGRTKYRILHWHQRDTMVLVVFVLMTIALVFLRS